MSWLVSLAPFNESVSTKIRAWPVEFENTYEPSTSDTFTVIDVSDPTQLDSFVGLDRVEEVIDHHLGFEDYWKARPNIKTQIEFAGAACTQVYERWQTAGLLEEMSETSARLLICGILDNTLNFGAAITADRDRQAHEKLLGKANLPEGWAAEYFSDCESGILGNISEAVRNDSKVLKFTTIDEPLSVGQLVVWDAQAIVDHNLKTVRAELASIQPSWFMNLIGLKDHRSYIITGVTQV